MADCKHEIITRAGDNHWVCDSCPEDFLPAQAVTAMADVQSEAVLDKMAGVMTAVLWDFHTRAIDHYGPQVADALKPPSCSETGQHLAWVDGRCRDCGAPQFLGG